MNGTLNSTLDAAPGPAWAGYDMRPIFGPFYWGSVASFLLAGITILQAWNYFPSRDKPFVQFMAISMVVLDTVSTLLTAEGMYLYVIPQFGSMLPLRSLSHVLAAECYLAVIIAFISQAYWAWQIYIVLNNSKKQNLGYIMSGVVGFLAVVAVIGGISCATFMIIDNDHILMARSYRFSVAVGIAKGAASLADIVATFSLCYFLSESRTGFDRTDSMVKKLMSYIVQRGILVTLVQITFMILFYMSTVRLNWLALHVNMTKVYANTFFAMLNGRAGLRQTGSNSTLTTSELNSTSRGGRNSMYIDTNDAFNACHGIGSQHSSEIGGFPKYPKGNLYIEKEVIQVSADI